MKPSQVALLCLILIAFLIFCVLIETYWDCRYKGGSMVACLPPIR